MLKQIDWYFDFISPFAYLACESLEHLPDGVELKPKPVLFAAMLERYDTRGPAEISPMRKFTFRHVCWLAGRHGIELTMPPAHPFNPLRLLRLCIAAGGDIETVRRLFRYVWRDGHCADEEKPWHSLGRELGVADIDAAIADPAVKNELRANTGEAIERGIFGVPSFVVDDEIFWGFDSMDFLSAYLRDPGLLASPGMRAADRMPEGQQRLR